MTMDKKIRRDETQATDAPIEFDELFLLDASDKTIAGFDDIHTLATVANEADDETLQAFLTANMPDVEPSADFTAQVMQRIDQYEEACSLVGIRWRHLLMGMGIISAVLFIVVSPFALTMVAFVDVMLNSVIAITGSLVLGMPSLQWGFVVASVLLLGWSGWAIRYMAKHSYS